MRVLSGVQPSGNLHIGNYFGAIRQFLSLQEEHECYYFLADLHALTTVQDRQRFRGLVRDLATGFLALGLDPARSVIYRQFRRGRIETELPVPSQNDGDVGPTTPLDIWVHAGRLRLLMPPRRPSYGLWPWRGEMPL